MDEKSFLALADAELKRIESAVENCDADIDIDFEADGILTLEFENGSKMIINRHAPGREIWVAARSGGFHFQYVANSWRNTRGGEELYAMLSRLVEEQAGCAVDLTV